MLVEKRIVEEHVTGRSERTNEQSIISFARFSNKSQRFHVVPWLDTLLFIRAPRSSRSASHRCGQYLMGKSESEAFLSVLRNHISFSCSPVSRVIYVLSFVSWNIVSERALYLYSNNFEFYVVEIFLSLCRVNCVDQGERVTYVLISSSTVSIYFLLV